MPQYQLNRETLADQVVHLLTQRLERENLQPGDSLPSIAKLADEFSVSKPIIREALKTLEGRGLIEMSSGKTPIIRSLNSDNLRLFFEHVIAFNPKSLIELLEIRRGLEIQSALLAAQNRNPEEIREMQTLIAHMRHNLYNHTMYAELDLRLHLLIATASRNTLMVYMVESVRDVLRDSIKEGLRSRFTDAQIQLVQQLHEQLVDAIVTGDAALAQKVMADHFDDAINAIYRLMLKEDV
jgi:DNA-binding FadR family transcriptional regulator